MRPTAVALILLALCLPCHAQAPAPPLITAEVTQTASSATDAGVTLAVHNAAPPSRPAQDVPITVTVAASGAFPAGTFPATVHYPALDTRYTGSVTLDIPLGFTLSGVADGGALTSDAKGQHLAYAVAGLDGGATFATTFMLSAKLTDTPAGLVATPSGPLTPIPATARPLPDPTTDAPKQ